MSHRILACAIAASALSGCSHVNYASTTPGKFSGRLDVRWIAPDLFIYEPSSVDPLRFVTSDGRELVPKRMVTDGGSIPRLFWSIPGYSPWGFGPAFVIHDWLFQAHHCRSSDEAWVTFPDSARILGEGIKYLMVAGHAPEDPTTFSAIVSAVRSPIAENLWNVGACTEPPDDIAFRREAPQGIIIQTINFGGQ